MYKKCSQAWWWQFVDLLKPAEDARALRFGDLVHRSLALYYKRGSKRGPHPAKTFKKLYLHEVEQLKKDRLNMRDEERWLDAEELGPAMLEGYVDMYGENDKQFVVLSSEQVFQRPLATRLPDGSKLVFYIVGTLDGLWAEGRSLKVHGDPFFKEFKTATTIDFSGLPMDEQAGTYWTYAPKWLARMKLMPPGADPTHILYTFLRKAMPDLRAENELGQKLNLPTKDELLEYYKEAGRNLPQVRTMEALKEDLGVEVWPFLGSPSKKQPSALFDRQPIYRDQADKENMHMRVCDEAVQMELTRRGFLKPIKNPGPLYMPNCKFCFARDMCELHETGADWEAMRDATMVKWDPYDSHEIVERW